MTVTTMPSACQPAPIAEAAAVLDARRHDLADVEQEARQTRAGIAAAQAEDRLAYARARDAGKRDPGAKHETAARERLDDVERRLGGERLRVAGAEDALRAALAENREQWTRDLDDALAAADSEALDAVAALERAEQQRTQLRATRAWLRTGKARTMPIQSPLRRNMNGDQFTVAELVDGVRDGIIASTLSAERERTVEHEREAREAQDRREARQRGVLA